LRVALRLRSKLVTAYSVDFDLFSDKDIERSLLPRVQRAFSDAASIAPLINNTDELTVLVDDVKVTFLKYPFPTFDPFVIHEQAPLQIVFLDDVEDTDIQFLKTAVTRSA
jgi:hypothetical protein